MKSGNPEIEAVVAAATAQRYQYFLHRKRTIFIRREGSDGPIDRLVDGGWVPRMFRWQPLYEKVWQSLDPDGLDEHVWGYLIPGLGLPNITWRQPRQRLSRNWVWRLFAPPLPGGASTRFQKKAFEWSRGAYMARFSSATGTTVTDLRDEALRGYQKQSDRGITVEQRANFFLGATGLTTTLVLGNAGLLLGAAKLHAPWLGLAIGALSVASVCSIAAGVRAMQAAMFTFNRAAPDGPSELFYRSGLPENESTRAYIGSLLAAQDREAIVSDWKVARVKAARRLFLGVIGGIVLLTAFVLLEAI